MQYENTTDASSDNRKKRRKKEPAVTSVPRSTRTKSKKHNERKYKARKVIDGWTKPTKISAMKVEDEDEFTKATLGESEYSYVKTIVSKLQQDLKADGLEPTRVGVTVMIMRPLILKLVEWMNQQRNLKCEKNQMVSEAELWQYVSIMIYSHMTNQSFEICLDILPKLVDKSIIFPSKEKLRFIQTHLLAYSPKNRGDLPGAETWNAQRDRTTFLSDFERLLLKSLLDVFVAPNAIISLDDELFGCRAKDIPKKSMSKRKADVEGYDAILLCEALFRVPIAINYRRRGESQEESVRTLIKALISVSGSASSAALTLMGDRGFGLEDLVAALTKIGINSLFIFPEHLPDSHPIIGESFVGHRDAAYSYDGGNGATVASANSSALEVLEAKEKSFVIPDGPYHGPLAVTTSKALAGSRKRIFASAIREHGDNKYSKIIRFEGHLPAYKNIDDTFVAVTRHVPSEEQCLHLFCGWKGKADEVISVSRSHGNDSNGGNDSTTSSENNNSNKFKRFNKDVDSAMRTYLDGLRTLECESSRVSTQDAVIPSTTGAPCSTTDASQSSQTKTIIGGSEGRPVLHLTSGTSRRTAVDASQDSPMLLSSSCSSDATNATGSSSSSSRCCCAPTKLCRSKQSKDTPRRRLEKTLNQTLRSASEAQLLYQSTPATLYQKTADWFMKRKYRYTGTSGGKLLEKDNIVRVLLGLDPIENRTETSDAAHLRSLTFDTWFSFSRSTEEMARGSVNEAPALNAIRGMTGVIKAFEVGMFERADQPWIAASPDFATIIDLSQMEDEVQRMFSALGVRYLLVGGEIKTGVADSGVLAATRNASSSTKVCSMGDETFCLLVDKAHRAQLLMESYVLDVAAMLYVRALETTNTKKVLIQIPDHTKSHCHRVLANNAKFVSWAHSSNPTVPSFADADTRAVLQTNLPMWQAVEARARAKGPFQHRVRLFKHSHQTLYSKGRGGVDGRSEYSAILKSPTAKLQWEPNVVTKGLKLQHAAAFDPFHFPTRVPLTASS